MDDRPDGQRRLPKNQDDRGSYSGDRAGDEERALEEQSGQSPSSMAAIIAGLVAAADIARQNSDPASAARWESAADSWRSSLADRTYTTDGFWGGHRYFERIDPTQDPNGAQTIHFDEGDFFAHD